MKNYLIIIFFLNLFWFLPVNAEEYLSDEKCAELAGDAKTDWAANEILDECYLQEKVMFQFQYRDDLKCAIKSGKARTETAAVEIYDSCVYG